MRVGKLVGVMVAVACGWGAAWAAGPAQPVKAQVASRPAPVADRWAPWVPLLGQWSPDGAKGAFSFERALGDHVLIRRNHLELPAANGRPAEVHDDLMVIYRAGNAVRAHYFDNEGHDLQYTATVPAPDRIVLVSDPVAGQPRFRLVYALTAPGKVNVGFEIAPPKAPDRFRPYLSGSAHRVAAPPSSKQ